MTLKSGEPSPAHARIFLSPKMLKNAFFSKSFWNFKKIRNTPLDIVTRKACTKFHEATTIRKDSKIGATVGDDPDDDDDGLKGHFGTFQSPTKKILEGISTSGFLYRAVYAEIKPQTKFQLAVPHRTWFKLTPKMALPFIGYSATRCAAAKSRMGRLGRRPLPRSHDI